MRYDYLTKITSILNIKEYEAWLPISYSFKVYIVFSIELNEHFTANIFWHVLFAVHTQMQARNWRPVLIR